MEIVELSIEDFESMINEIKILRQENDELIRAVAFLNAQIKDYNKKFGSTDSKEQEK